MPAAKDFPRDPIRSPRHKNPLTVAEIRDSVRSGYYVGDMFEALEFILREYDIVYNKLKFYTKPTTYTVASEHRNDFGNATGADVV